MDKLLIPCSAKILPLSYDESLSYYEQLCKITYTVNELVEVFNDDLDGIIAAVSEILQNKIDEYINNNFDNLMMNAIYNEENETITLKKGSK